MLLAVKCPPPKLLPPFVSSTPAEGETVSREAWLVARFAGEVAKGAEDRVWLFCDGSLVARSIHWLAPDALVINPQGSLPANATCRLDLVTEAGPVTVLFQTEPARAPLQAVYDRSDPLQLAPFPDDFWIVEDPSLPSGNAIDFPVPPFSELFQLQAFQALQALTVGVDGWSRQPPIVLAFTGAPAQVVPDDLFASQNPMATIWLVDVDRKAGLDVAFPTRSCSGSDWAPDGTVDHVAILVPSIDLRERGQYAVVVTRRAGFGPSPFFEEVLSGKPATRRSW
jgi:hypothetical protein